MKTRVVGVGRLLLWLLAGTLFLLFLTRRPWW